MANIIGDAYLVYNLVKKLITPFDKWPAFKLGIIDAKGNVLKKKSMLRTSEENNAWGYFDMAVANLKKILAKLPGGSTRLASFAAAAFLFKEHKQYNFEVEQDAILFEENFKNYLNVIEDVAVNNVGGGQVAGLGVGAQGEPPGRTAMITRMLKRKKLEKKNATNS